jgi:hypothetical protein
MTMSRGVHGEKLVAAINSEKLPENDIPRLRNAIEVYDRWVESLNNVEADDLDNLIQNMVGLLNEYKTYIDLDLIFDSHDDFLYRQKGQLKIDNTVVEEFLPVFTNKCIKKQYGACNIDIGSQTQTFSSVNFESSLSNPAIGGGMRIKTKDQDFSMSRKLYIRSSYTSNFEEDKTINIITNLGYVLAEIKTNLDKTMFQEASATAHDIKLAVTGAKYFLLCDFLDMKPISTATTDIDEILILRKAKRINSNVRSQYSSYANRILHRAEYVEYLNNNPYSVEIFKRFIEHVFAQIINEELIEENVLNIGYF